MLRSSIQRLITWTRSPSRLVFSIDFSRSTTIEIHSRCLVTDAVGRNNILYGKPVADRILNTCANDCREYFTQFQRRPRLVAILVGGNESSKLYVRNKQRTAEHIGCSLRLSPRRFTHAIFRFLQASTFR